MILSGMTSSQNLNIIFGWIIITLNNCFFDIHIYY